MSSCQDEQFRFREETRRIRQYEVTNARFVTWRYDFLLNGDTIFCSGVEPLYWKPSDLIPNVVVTTIKYSKAEYSSLDGVRIWKDETHFFIAKTKELYKAYLLFGDYILITVKSEEFYK